jgi:hypothetical protein
MTETEDTADQAAPPIQFVAPMSDERLRFLLRHLPQLHNVEEPLSGEVKQLGEQGFLWLVRGRFVLTEKARKLLETL